MRTNPFKNYADLLRKERLYGAAAALVGSRWFRRSLLIAALSFGAIAVWRSIIGDTDIDGFYRAAEMVWDRKALSADRAVDRYLPVFQTLMAPLTILPLSGAAALWTLLNLASLANLPRLFEQLYDVPFHKQLFAWFVALPFVIDNINLCQNGPVLLFLTMQGIVWVKGNRQIPGGGLIGLAALLKILPIVFMGIALGFRRWRSFVGFGIVVVLGFAWMVTLIGWDASFQGLQTWWHSLQTSSSPWTFVEQGRSLRFVNQGLLVTIARTICDIDPTPKGAVQLASVSLPVAKGVYVSVLLLVSGVTAVVGWRSFLKRSCSEWPGLTAIFAVLLLVVSPVVWTHYFIWLLPVLVYLSYRPGLLIIIGLVSLAGLASPYTRGLGLHMMIGLVLFGMAAFRLLKQGQSTGQL